MKYYLQGLAVAVSLGLSMSVQAAASDGDTLFSHAPLSKKKISRSFDPKQGCFTPHGACDTKELQRSRTFWLNIIIGGKEAAQALDVTPYTKSAARFLMRTTFGPTAREINELAAAIEAKGERAAFEIWIDEQAKLKQTLLSGKVKQVIHLQGPAWWQNSLTARDQLRQRVTFALNHILTNATVSAETHSGGLANYYDILGEYALGSVDGSPKPKRIKRKKPLNTYQDLITAVTYDISMGKFLNNLSNVYLPRLAKQGKTQRPNENYARELLQLFSIGTQYLNKDGSVAEARKPTYSEADVHDLGEIFSGMTTKRRNVGSAVMLTLRHFEGEKTLFRDTDQEVNISAAPKTEIRLALRAIANHPNVAPFMAKRLIQNMVMSNPSPHYIQDVAQAFDNNQGEMLPVIKAILLHDEALAAPDNIPSQYWVADQDNDATNGDKHHYYGKLKEPALRMSNLLRSFESNPFVGNTGFGTHYLMKIQKPLYAPSVFSFFQPDDSQKGLIEEANKVAPEFKLVTDLNQAVLHREFGEMILETNVHAWARNTGYYTHMFMQRENRPRATDPAVLAETNPEALIDRYNLLLMGGSMTEATKNTLVTFLNNSTDSPSIRARKALYLVMISPQQAVQH